MASTPVPHLDIGRGIDQFHTEDKIPDGYWTDLLNADPTPEGGVKKRPGYQRYAGSIPVRVTAVEHSGTNIDLTLDSSFDIDDLRSTPILVYGRTTSSQSGDFTTTPSLKYYAEFSISSGKLRVSDSGSVSATYTDSTPQLSVWGLPWSTDYQAAGSDGGRWGWLQALAVYSNSSTSYPVAGLGGNFFAGRTRADVGSTYGMPRVYPQARATKNAGSTVIGPAFALTGATPSRTRSYVTGDGVSAGFAACTGATYDSGTGYVDFVVSLPNMVVAGTLATTITADLDYLTVDRLSTGLNGTWLVKQVTQGANLLTIRCAVDDVIDTRYDVSGAGGLAGIFTDKLTVSAGTSGRLVGGDSVTSTGLPAATTDVVVMDSSDLFTLMLGDLDGEYTIGAAEVLYGTRTSRLVICRDSGGTATTTNLVAGDMLDVVQAGTELGRRVRIRSVNSASDRFVDISGDGVEATVVLTSGYTTGLSVGDIIRFAECGAYNGDHEVTEIVSSVSLKFDSTETASVTGGKLVGETIGLDEELTLADSSDNSTYLEVHARWIPLEWPTPPSTTIRATQVQHFDQLAYDEQQFVSSASLQDNLYLCDGVHPVHKYDGTNLYRAGLPKWQSHLLAYSKSSTYARGVIPGSSVSIVADAVLGSSTYTVTLGEEGRVSVGDYVVAADTGTYIGQVLAAYADATDGFIELTHVWSEASGAMTIYPRQAYKYYQRLNLIDANNNVVATAQTSSQDVNQVFGQGSQVQLREAAYPRLPGFDLTRLDLQIYRTAESLNAPFFRLASIPVPFANSRGYLGYNDVTPSKLLINESGQATGTLDEVASALTGSELGTAWDQPPIAKYLASTSGRLLAANIIDYEQLDLLLRAPRSTPEAKFDYTPLHGSVVYLRRNGATGTTSNVTDVFVYEVVDYNSIASTTTRRAVSQAQDVASDGSTFTVSFTSTHINCAAGDWIYLSAESGQMAPFTTDSYMHGWWQVASTSTSGGRNHLVIRTNLRAPLTCAAASVDTGADTFTVASHGLATGDVITFGSSSTLPAGLVENSPYYVIRVSTNAFSVASSLALALAGTDIDLTTQGSGTHKILIGDYSSLVGFVASTQTRVPVLVFSDKYSSPAEEAGYSTRADREVLVSEAARELQFPRKLAAAINASMTNFDTVQFSGLYPWVSAFAGNDYGPGQLVLRRLDVDDTYMTVEHTLPAASLTVYASGTQLAASTRLSATRRLFPSRICRSYPNYPEIFDAPYLQLDSESDSAIDVNPSDGQELTGIISFFGDSAFGDASKEALFVATKTRSVYIVDVETKRVQKLNTKGKGCVYPRSLQHTEDGVMFASYDGLYKINRQFQCVYVGKWVQRPFRGRFDHTVDADVPCAAHDDYASQYRLSYPIGTDGSNSEALVYDHTRESGDEPGTWTRYDNLPATCWTNVESDSMFGTSGGLVMSMRRSGTRFDYRDDDSGVSMLATYKATNFGSEGVRNFIHAVTIGFRLTARMAGTVVRAATELLDSFSDLDIFVDLDSVNLDARDADSNLVDLERAPVRTPQFGLPEKRAEYVQMQIENSTIDEPVELTKLVFHVEPGNRAGTLAASESDD